MVCSYLVYTGMSAEEALRLYAEKRTTNNEGVSYTNPLIITVDNGSERREPEIYNMEAFHSKWTTTFISIFQQD